MAKKERLKFKASSACYCRLHVLYNNCKIHLSVVKNNKKKEYKKSTHNAVYIPMIQNILLLRRTRYWIRYPERCEIQFDRNSGYNREFYIREPSSSYFPQRLIEARQHPPV